MRIVFVGEIETPYVSTTSMRLRALMEQGHDVHPVCTVRHLAWGGRLWGFPFRRLASGPPVWSLNRAVRKAVWKVRPEILWVEKGNCILPKTLHACRRLGVTCVHYTPDPAFVCHRTRHFDRDVALYDLLVTNKPYERQEYERLGARHLMVQPSTFDLHLHRPVCVSAEAMRQYACDIVFVGSYCEGREYYLEPLARTSMRVAIWGNGWSRCPVQSLRERWRGRGTLGDEYATILSAAKIGLGLLSPLCPDGFTTRSVEIPACGTFLLAQRTEEHLAVFRESEEAEFFDSPEELVRKAEYYLENEQERLRIAAGGRRLCVEGGYSNQSRVQEIVTEALRLRSLGQKGT